MTNPRAELSSITSALDDLTSRISDLAERSNRDGQDDLANELFEVERSLTGGKRRLERIVSR